MAVVCSKEVFYIGSPLPSFSYCPVCGEVCCVLSSFAIVPRRKRELVALAIVLKFVLLHCKKCK